MPQKAASQSLVPWLLQRITGLFLAFFLVTHLNVHHLFHDITVEGIISFALVQERLTASFWWQVYYFLFVPMVVYHALNGIWEIIADFRVSTGWSFLFKAMFWILGIVLIVVAAITLSNLF